MMDPAFSTLRLVCYFAGSGALNLQFSTIHEDWDTERNRGR